MEKVHILMIYGSFASFFMVKDSEEQTTGQGESASSNMQSVQHTVFYI